MKKISLWVLARSLLAAAGSLKEALRIYADGENRTPEHGVLSVSSSVRLRPGKFGQAYLIERRTRNFADPQEWVLGSGAELTGEENLLRLPADGFAALPQIGLKPRGRNMLSFQGRGSGKIAISLTENGATRLLAEFSLQADFQQYSCLVESDSDAATLKFRSTAAAELNQLLFDRGIAQVNSYHPPGKIRGVDLIRLDHQLYNPAAGSFVCWLKAPWFGSTGEGTAMGIFHAAASKDSKKTSQGVVLWGGVDQQTGKYESTLHNIHYSGKGGFNCGISFRLSELIDVPNHEWQHLTFNWEMTNGGMNSAVYINGQQKFSSSKNKFVPQEVEELLVGYINGSYTNGLIDEIAVFARPLTEREIETLAKSGKTIAELTE